MFVSRQAHGFAREFKVAPRIMDLFVLDRHAVRGVFLEVTRIKLFSRPEAARRANPGAAPEYAYEYVKSMKEETGA
jgi:hypothetical protein